MSTINHPNIVRFLGVAGSRLPAMVMERLLTNLHDLLDPERDTQLPRDARKASLPLSLKCSILHNVASGLTYLHERSPPIIHRDLSARNILLTSGMVAKIVDLGVARIVARMRTAATMTKGPGASVYMPPESVDPAEMNICRNMMPVLIYSLLELSLFSQLVKYSPAILLLQRIFMKTQEK